MSVKLEGFHAKIRCNFTDMSYSVKRKKLTFNS